MDRLGEPQHLRVFLAACVVVVWIYIRNIKPDPRPALSKNFGSASYAPQQFDVPGLYYAMQGVSFGKSSKSDTVLRLLLRADGLAPLEREAWGRPTACGGQCGSLRKS
jgi:hypothetical protein